MSFRDIFSSLVWLVFLTSSVKAEEVFFPQIAAGGVASGTSFETLLFLNNINPNAISVHADLFDDNGQPLVLKINDQTESTFDQVVQPGATVRLSITSDTTVGIPGWLKLTSPARINAAAIVRLINQGSVISEVGVLPSTKRVAGTVVVEQGSGLDTGLAVANPQDREITAVLSFFDKDGSQIGEKTLKVPPKGHQARFFTEIFQLDDGGGGSLLGSVGILSDLPVVAVSLRLQNLKLTSVPVVDGHPTQAISGHLVVFTRSGKTGNGTIAMFDLERNKELDLPDLNSEAFNSTSPAVTPDGRFIVFRSAPITSAFGGLFLYDRQNFSKASLDTINAFTLPGVDPDRGNLNISNKGRFILFDMTRRSTGPSAPPVKGAILLFDRVTNSFVPLQRIIDLKNAADTSIFPGNDLLTASGDHAPFLSYDSSLIAFITNTTVGTDIVLYDRGKEKVIPLPRLKTDPRGSDVQPSLSADNRFLVFSSNRNTPLKNVYTEQSDIFLYDLQEEKLVDLPGLNDPNAVDGHPSISADGRLIVFHSNRNGNFDLFLYDRQTSTLKALPVNTPAWEAQPRIVP